MDFQPSKWAKRWKKPICDQTLPNILVENDLKSKYIYLIDPGEKRAPQLLKWKKSNPKTKKTGFDAAVGGGHFIFGTSFNFPLCFPKGAHSLGHRWGQFPTSGAIFNFPLCYTKGAHSLGHRWGQLLTSGAKFNFRLCYRKGAHSLGAITQAITSGAKFNFLLCYHKGAHSLGHWYHPGIQIRSMMSWPLHCTD